MKKIVFFSLLLLTYSILLLGCSKTKKTESKPEIVIGEKPVAAYCGKIIGKPQELRGKAEHSGSILLVLVEVTDKRKNKQIFPALVSYDSIQNEFVRLNVYREFELWEYQIKGQPETKNTVWVVKSVCE